jgi:hypothetical protein
MLDDIKKTLWATADKLRANMDAAEYKHLVLGLIFVKYISDTFAARRSELKRRFADPADDYYLDDPDLLAGELEDRNYYKEVNVFWVPESARWEALRGATKQTNIGKQIDDALTLIEVEKPPGSKATSTSATRVRNCTTASSANWLIWFPPSALVTNLPTIAVPPATCSGRSTNISSASSPAPRARRAGSSNTGFHRQDTGRRSRAAPRQGL